MRCQHWAPVRRVLSTVWATRAPSIPTLSACIRSSVIGVFAHLARTAGFPARTAELDLIRATPHAPQQTHSHVEWLRCMPERSASCWLGLRNRSYPIRSSFYVGADYTRGATRRGGTGVVDVGLDGEFDDDRPGHSARPGEVATPASLSVHSSVLLATGSADTDAYLFDVGGASGTGMSRAHHPPLRVHRSPQPFRQYPSLASLAEFGRISYSDCLYAPRCSAQVSLCSACRATQTAFTLSTFIPMTPFSRAALRTTRSRYGLRRALGERGERRGTMARQAAEVHRASRPLERAHGVGARACVL